MAAKLVGWGKAMLQVEVLTLFPDMFAALSDYGVSARAIERDLLKLGTVNPRDFALDKHRTVDDKPYGGGPGMVMMVEPLVAALQSAKSKLNDQAKVIYLSPQGRPLTQSKVDSLAKAENLILVCGRYEGIDERFIKRHVDEEVSVGDYVVSGGELPAMLLLDAMIRQLPGALGSELSAPQDSLASAVRLLFSNNSGLLSRVLSTCCSKRYSAIFAWSPLKSTSGTTSPSIRSGRVKCG